MSTCIINAFLKIEFSSIKKKRLSEGIENSCSKKIFPYNGQFDH